MISVKVGRPVGSAAIQAFASSCNKMIIICSREYQPLEARGEAFPPQHVPIKLCGPSLCKRNAAGLQDSTLDCQCASTCVADLFFNL